MRTSPDQKIKMLYCLIAYDKLTKLYVDKKQCYKPQKYPVQANLQMTFTLSCRIKPTFQYSSLHIHQVISNNIDLKKINITLI